MCLFSPTQMIQFLKSKKFFLKRIVTHLGTSAITELLLRMVQCSEGSAVKKELTEVSLALPLLEACS